MNPRDQDRSDVTCRRRSGKIARLALRTGEKRMRSGRLVAGVDSSTQSTKVLVIEPDSGKVVAMGRGPHTVGGTGGARETDPREWWAALRSALAATGRAGEIGAISVGGQQHGLVLLDSTGVPVRDAILWNDTRSAGDAVRLIEALGARTWVNRSGLRPVASFTITKWAWVRRTEPGSAAAAAAIRLPHDYLTERLTARPVTDRGDASGTGWWSPGDERYADDLLALPAVGIVPDMLPTVLGPEEQAGEVTSRAASELGLASGTVVGPGTGDNMAAALGLGLRLGQPALSLGTSGTVFAVAERPSADESGIVAGFADATGRFLPLACTLNCTLAVDRVAGWLGLERDDVAPADSVVVLPYLDGERTPDLPGAAGTITGLRHATTPQQLLMAAYEGAVASLLEALAAIGDESGGFDSTVPLVLVGGGARGRTWQEVVRRLSGRPVLVPDAEELVALGAAVQATAVWRNESPAAVARRWRTDAGTVLDPLPRDDRRLEQIQAIRDVVAETMALSGGHG
jgi:xylulokinase